MHLQILGARRRFRQVRWDWLLQVSVNIKFKSLGCCGIKFIAVCSLLSIYGGVRFADEDLGLAHKSGSVVMANAGETPGPLEHILCAR